MASEELEALKLMLRSVKSTVDVPIADQRAGIDGLAVMLPMADGVTVEAVDAGGVPAEWHRVGDADPSDGVILVLHGGGYVIGSPTSHRAMASQLAVCAGRPVLVLDYRLAPEHPSPAAIDDAMAAWRWLLDDVQVPASRAAWWGDSAGGGLAVATLQRAVADGIAVPAGVALISPWVDLTGTAPAMTSKAAADPVLDPALMGLWAAAYAGGRPLDDPAVSPLFGELAGLPPMLIQATDDEVLVDDATRLTAAVEAAGGSVTLDVRPGLLHAWHIFRGAAPECDAAIADVAGFLRATVEAATDRSGVT